MLDNLSRFGTIKKITNIEPPQESVWSIQFVIPEYYEWMKENWEQSELTDLGGNTTILRYETVYNKGKGFFVEFMSKKIRRPEVIDVLWARMEKAAKEESVFFV